MRARFARWGHAFAAAIVIAVMGPPSAGAAAPVRVKPPPHPPMELPGDRATARVAAAPSTWIVGGRPSAATTRIAERFGAKRLLRGTGAYGVARPRARAFAAELRAAGVLTFAEPDRALIRAAFPSDPDSGSQWALPAIGATQLTPPPVTADSPSLGIIEDDIDLGHPEFAGARIALTPRPLLDGDHGTMVTSVAAAPDNGVGMLGVWPGMNVVVAPSTNRFCSGAVGAIEDALARNVSVINMSYEFGHDEADCYLHEIATSRAFGEGVVPVAAAGNRFEEGNPPDRIPSSDPHILTVGAVQPDLSAAPFSTAHAGVDLAAPGVNVLAAVPPNDYAYVDGTSFSAPIVAAATAWVKAVRPTLDHTQLIELVRSSVRDLGPPGWDPRFGFGLLDLPTALTAAAPSTDRLEPNDDVRWINGSLFVGSDKPISRGRKNVSFRSRLDVLEDPADVYRVRVPSKRSLRISVDPLAGATNLRIFSRKAATVYESQDLIGQARRTGSKVDRLRITNRSTERRLVYVNVYPDPRADTLDARYKITVKKVKYKRNRGKRVP